MTRSQIIFKICQKINIPQKEAERAVTSFFNSIVNALSLNDRIELRGFGTFRIKHYKSYIGRNPKSGLSIVVKPKRMPYFKASKIVRTIINK
jgi:integration host factor subunit beta